MKIPDREPDVIFPFSSIGVVDNLIETRIWVNEGLIQHMYKGDSNSSYIWKHSTREVLNIIEVIAIKSISLEKRVIAANYLVSRALLE